MTTSRQLLNAATALSATLGAALSAPLAHADDAFPAKLVTLVTAFAPGSGPDAVLRLVAEKLGKAWSQRVLVENKPGAAASSPSTPSSAPRPTVTRCCSSTASTSPRCRTCTRRAASRR